MFSQAVSSSVVEEFPLPLLTNLLICPFRGSIVLTNLSAKLILPLAAIPAEYINFIKCVLPVPFFPNNTFIPSQKSKS